MARPLRIERAGAWYHVTGRGLERRAIFLDARDRRRWLELLGEASDLWGWVIHGYVQMGNHFHLIVETPEPNLSRIMHGLNTSYVAWFNRRQERAGPLFQGVYKAIVVDPIAWGLALSRYVHLNPVRTVQMGLSKAERKADGLGVRGRPEARLVRERVERLGNFRWSSYRAYIGLERAAPWLECRRILEFHGRGTRVEQHGAYQRYVEEAVREGLAESPWEKVKAQLWLGSQQGGEKIRAAARGHHREQPQTRRLVGRPSFSQVMRVVEELKGQKWEQFENGHADWGRDLGLYLGRRISGLKLRELGAAIGGADYATVSIAVKRFERRVGIEKQMAQLVKKATTKLSNVEC